MPKRKQQTQLTEDGGTKTVGFRVDPHHFALLEERAKLAGQSVGELSRSMVIDVLNQQTQIALLREKVLALEGILEQIRRDIAFSTAALLSPHKLTKEQAIEYVNQNLRQV